MKFEISSKIVVKISQLFSLKTFSYDLTTKNKTSYKFIFLAKNQK